MATKIYNEGRVVGFSAYEIYVRHLLSQDPDAKVPTEKQWLAASIGSGSSMLLKIPKSSEGIHEVELPAGSTLCAAGVIVASAFDGDAEFDSKGWATRITSYGSLISNTDTSHPPISTGVPAGEFDWEATLDIMKSYLCITDGIFIQPGTWSEPEEGFSPPARDFQPNPKGLGYVRLKVAEKTTSTTYILLTGFMNRTIVTSLITENGGCLNTPSPSDGDFLGPQEFPWASRIIFTVPNQANYLLTKYKYGRKLPLSEDAKFITSSPVIDFENTDPKTYYESTRATDDIRYNHSSSLIPLRASQHALGSGVSVLTAYQNKESTSNKLSGHDYPPILYGTKVTKDGDTYLCPLDTAAPGTVKVFSNAADDDIKIVKALATNYPKIVKNTYSIYVEKSFEGSTLGNTDVYLMDEENSIKITTDVDIKLLKMVDGVEPEDGESVTAGGLVNTVTISAKDTEAKVLSFTKPDGQWLNMQGNYNLSSSSDGGGWGHCQYLYNPENKYQLWGKGLDWAGLLSALNNSEFIRILGPDLAVIEQTKSIQLSGTASSYVGGTFTSSKAVGCSHGLASYSKLVSEDDDSYMEFAVGVSDDGEHKWIPRRLYIQSNTPTGDIPDGSIWIGGE